MTRVLVISRHVAALVKECAVPASKIGLLHPGVRADFAHGNVSDGLPLASAPVLLFVGRVVRRKGLREFLELCLPKILREERAEVWVVGGEPCDSLGHPAGEYARVRRSVERCEYRSSVRFLGWLSEPELRCAYAKAQILILPAIAVDHDAEGFGLVFLEAACFGVPAVSTSIGGISDAVADGETGLLVRPGEWDDFAAQVVRLIRDDDLRRKLGGAARSRAAESFSWGHVAARCSEQLLDVVSE